MLVVCVWVVSLLVCGVVILGGALIVLVCMFFVYYSLLFSLWCVDCGIVLSVVYMNAVSLVFALFAVFWVCCFAVSLVIVVAWFVFIVVVAAR